MNKQIKYCIQLKLLYPGTFGCNDGQCLSTSLKCNGENNCGDMSDETDCRKFLNLFFIHSLNLKYFRIFTVVSFSRLKMFIWVNYLLD